MTARGEWAYLARARQPVSFEGFQFGTITPTDVDGLIEFHGRRLVLMEFKLAGAPFPDGQRVALARWIDAIGPPLRACLFVAAHTVRDPAEPVRAVDATVVWTYTDRRWTAARGVVNLYDAVATFLHASDHRPAPRSGRRVLTPRQLPALITWLETDGDQSPENRELITWLREQLEGTP